MNVWRKTQKEDKSYTKQVCSNDIDHDLFDLTLIIKDDKAINVVKDMIKTNWIVFYVNFIEKMMNPLGLEHYPEMHYQNAMSYADTN